MFRTEHAGPRPLKAEVTLLHRKTQSRKMQSRVIREGVGLLQTNNILDDFNEVQQKID